MFYRPYQHRCSLIYNGFLFPVNYCCIKDINVLCENAFSLLTIVSSVALPSLPLMGSEHLG